MQVDGVFTGDNVGNGAAAGLGLVLVGHFDRCRRRGNGSMSLGVGWKKSVGAKSSKTSGLRVGGDEISWSLSEMRPVRTSELPLKLTVCT